MAITPEIKIHLVHDLIPFWLSMKDEEFGGYYGFVSGNRELNKRADKGCILNSGILWAMSSCYKLCIDGVLSETKLQDAGYSSMDILDAARHAYEFLSAHFIDLELGGLYWSVTYDGRPSDTTKHTYNHAFAIYALSAYFEVSGDMQAFKLAYYLKNCIENMFTDDNGYLESFSRDFTPDDNPHLSNNGVSAVHTMNTMLHVIEAYCELYRINKETKDTFIRKKIMRNLELHAEKIYNSALGRQEVFFDNDYNSLIDLYSPGHDIEMAWVLDKVCEIFMDDELSARENPISRRMEENVLKYAFDGNSLFYEAENGKIKDIRAWWIQSEAVVGFINAYTHTGDRNYLIAAQNQWNFIRDYVIDKARPAEWHNAVSPDGTPDTTLPLVSEWKCPYHNIRMCIEILRRQERMDEEI